jgi:hypothetical protein
MRGSSRTRAGLHLVVDLGSGGRTRWGSRSRWAAMPSARDRGGNDREGRRCASAGASRAVSRIARRRSRTPSATDGGSTALADRFVGMYVNDLTLDYGERPTRRGPLPPRRSQGGIDHARPSRRVRTRAGGLVRASLCRLAWPRYALSRGRPLACPAAPARRAPLVELAGPARRVHTFSALT